MLVPELAGCGCHLILRGKVVAQRSMKITAFRNDAHIAGMAAS